MSVITALLDKLSLRRAEVSDLQAEIEALAPALVTARDAAAAEVKALEADIKKRAGFIPDSQAHTLVGADLQLVWNQPAPKLDPLKVEALLNSWNLATGDTMTPADLTSPAEGFWAIRKRGKGG